MKADALPPHLLLDGFRVEVCGTALPLRIAARHLAELGASIVPAIALPRPGSCGFLRVLGEPRAAIECGVRWDAREDSGLSSDVLVQAATGLMHVHGRREGGARRLGVDFPSIVCGVLTSLGVLAGILARLRGHAERLALSTSVTDAAFVTLLHYLAAATSDQGYVAAAAEDTSPPPFRSADGVRYELEFLDPEQWKAFWTALGADPRDVSAGWRGFVFRYAHATAPVPRALHAILGRTAFEEVVQRAQAAGGMACALESCADSAFEALNDAQPWTFELGPRSQDRRSHAPPDRAGPPLAGVTILESTRRIQGPLATRLLQCLGASVIRVEPPGGDPLRQMPPFIGDTSARFLAFNAGKIVHELDLASEAGARRALELGDGVDAFLQNWAPGKAASFGLGPGEFWERSRIVYAQASGLGGKLGDRAPIGTDFMVQGATGLGNILRPDEEQRGPSLVTLLDVLGACLCAQGILAGLILRERSGRTVRVETSLLSAARLIQASAITTSGDGASYRDEVRALHQPVRAADGFIQIGDLDPPALHGLYRLFVHTGDAPPTTAALELAVRNAMLSEPALSLLDRLRRAGVPSVPVACDLRHVSTDESFVTYTEQNAGWSLRSPWRLDNGE